MEILLLYFTPLEPGEVLMASNLLMINY